MEYMQSGNRLSEISVFVPGIKVETKCRESILCATSQSNADQNKRRHYVLQVMSDIGG